jgi:hypothetical protein
MPASGFTRRLLRSEEIVDVMAPVLQRIKAGNPDLRVILTVSPSVICEMDLWRTTGARPL